MAAPRRVTPATATARAPAGYGRLSGTRPENTPRPGSGNPRGVTIHRRRPGLGERRQRRARRDRRCPRARPPLTLAHPRSRRAAPAAERQPSASVPLRRHPIAAEDARARPRGVPEPLPELTWTAGTSAPPAAAACGALCACALRCGGCTCAGAGTTNKMAAGR